MVKKVPVVLINEASKMQVTLPRVPTEFKDDQSPQYDTQNTPAGAIYQAMSYQHSGTRTWGFRVLLLPEVDGTATANRIVQFVLDAVRPTWYNGRYEPPDVSVIYGGTIRRGKVTKRSLTYGQLSPSGVAREISVDVELTMYVRPEPKKDGAGLVPSP